MIYPDSQSMLVLEDNRKQNPVLYKQISKTQYIVYGYKLVCVDDKFSKPFKIYLCIDAVYNFVNSIIKRVNIEVTIKKKTCDAERRQ